MLHESIFPFHDPSTSIPLVYNSTLALPADHTFDDIFPVPPSHQLPEESSPVIEVPFPPETTQSHMEAVDLPFSSSGIKRSTRTHKPPYYLQDYSCSTIAQVHSFFPSPHSLHNSLSYDVL